MGSFRALLLSAFLLQAACEQFKNPVVESIVENVLSTYANYIHFDGNHTNSTSLSKRQSSSYWYENINHQGISAFGPSGYQVFRNVKSYGAKGVFNSYTVHVHSHADIKSNKVTE